MATKKERPISIVLRRVGDNYIVARLVNAVTITVVDRGQSFDIRIGNTLVEREAKELARQFAVTVR